MISAIDSSVILDVITSDNVFTESSIKILRRARTEGKLILCECVPAEIYPAVNDEDAFREFLQDWQLNFVPSSEQSALLAGKHFTKYLQRGGTKKRVLPDFLIASHALIHADRLVARDRGYLRDYFSSLTVLDPSGS